MKGNKLFLITMIIVSLLVIGCPNPVSAGPKPTYTVTFETNGGTLVEDQIVTEGEGIVEPTAPEKEDTSYSGYTFNMNVEGWYLEPEFINKWNFTGSELDTVTENITLYCRFTIVGCTGQAGGLIFYDDEEDGSDDITGRFLEVAPEDFRIGNTTEFSWSNVTDVEVGTTYMLGNGLSNTNSIISQTGHTSSAALYCSNYELTNNGNTYSDWYLPSYRELFALKENLVHKFEDINTMSGVYWCSTESSATYGYLVNMNFMYSYGSYSNIKSREYKFRPIRSF